MATLYRRGHGMASLEHRIPITASTVFNVGSISKQFTALAILLLEEEAKVSLDDDIRRYAPELPDLHRAITLRHLMHHTSGLRSSRICWPSPAGVTGMSSPNATSSTS